MLYSHLLIGNSHSFTCRYTLFSIPLLSLSACDSICILHSHTCYAYEPFHVLAVVEHKIRREAKATQTFGHTGGIRCCIFSIVHRENTACYVGVYKMFNENLMHSLQTTVIIRLLHAAIDA